MVFIAPLTQMDLIIVGLLWFSDFSQALSYFYWLWCGQYLVNIEGAASQCSRSSYIAIIYCFIVRSLLHILGPSAQCQLSVICPLGSFPFGEVWLLCVCPCVCTEPLHFTSSCVFLSVLSSCYTRPEVGVTTQVLFLCPLSKHQEDFLLVCLFIFWCSAAHHSITSLPPALPLRSAVSPRFVGGQKSQRNKTLLQANKKLTASFMLNRSEQASRAAPDSPQTYSVIWSFELISGRFEIKILFPVRLDDKTKYPNKLNQELVVNTWIFSCAW